MNFGRAFLAGVVGGLVMAIMITAAHQAGVTPMNMPMYLGSVITHDLSTSTWWLGLVMHLILSGVIALIYAVGFEYVTHRSSWLIGAGFGVIHFLIAGVVIGMMGQVHPMMVPPPPPPPPGSLTAPGFFATNFAIMSTVGFLVGHLVYGAVVGAIYKTVHAHPETQVEA